LDSDIDDCLTFDALVFYRSIKAESKKKKKKRRRNLFFLLPLVFLDGIVVPIYYSYMASLPTADPLPFEQSYRRVTNDLQRWLKKILGQVDRMCDNVVQDMDQTLNQVNAFIDLMKNLLIEQDKQLARAMNNQEMDCIEGRIEQILIEIEVLKCR
jgi:hypothetical protein